MKKIIEGGLKSVGRGLKRGVIGLGTAVSDLGQNRTLNTIQKRDPYLFSEEYLGKPTDNIPGSSYDQRVQAAKQLDAKTRTRMGEKVREARTKRVGKLESLIK